MANNFLKKYIDKLSFYRLTGIKQFAILDINKSSADFYFVELKEPFYWIDKSKEIKSLKVISYENIEFNNDYSTLTNKLKILIEKNKLEEVNLIIGLNEFRFKTIKIPKDSEENEFWFEENTDKFLPEGKISDDFIFSYEKYFQDEDNDYYIVISRKNYIESIISAFNIDKINIVNISPFVFHVHALNHNSNVLYLKLSQNKIIYSFYDGKQNLVSGESFLSINDSKNIDEEEFFQNVKNSLNEIKQNLISLLNEDLKVFYSESAANQLELPIFIKSIFNTDQIFSNIFNLESDKFIPAIVLNQLINGKDKQIDLTTSEIKSESRELLEKKTSLRIVLAFGISLIVILLTIYLGETILNNAMNNNSNKIVEYDSKSKMLETYRSENAEMLNNLSTLTQLKNNRVVYSKVLSSLSEILNNQSCFTDVEIKEADKVLDITINGLAYSQPDVTDLLRNIEQVNTFSNVSLKFANSVTSTKYNGKVRLPQINMIDFSFTAEFYDDKK